MKTHLLLLSSFLIFCANIKISAFIGSGGGTSGDPYLVSTAAEFNDVRNNLTAYYKQNMDIDLSGYSPWSKIGTTITAGTNFTGTYDGDGHKITGLSITSTSDQYNGLFGVIGSGGTVKNLGVTGASLSGSHAGLGILAGYNFGGTVENCYTTGTVTTSNNNPGGLLGSSSGTVTKCYSTATVTATGATSSNVGGLIGAGLTASGSISQCYSTGNVSNNNTSGSYNTGGFIGMIAHSISNCYSTGNVSSSTGGRAGGFIGGTGTGTPAFTYCYSTGLVTCPTKGGFVGYVNTGSFSNCFFDYNTAGTSNTYGAYQTSAPTGITAHTTAEMKTNTTFTDAGWSESIWYIGDGINNGYPYLSWQNPGGSPLPVELTSFIANTNGKEVELKWSTATEVNNYGFNLERRTMNEEWEKIAFIQGHGNSNSPKEYSFCDKPIGGSKVRYRLKQIDTDGSYTYSSEIEVYIENTPTEFVLSQNFPNPFNPTTIISYNLPKDGIVTIKIFDVLGREIKTLVNDYKTVGSYSTNWDGKDKLSNEVSAGIYFYNIRFKDQSLSKKMLMMK